MFSHIADETRSLTHGFLGALFSVILVMTDTGHGTIFLCCVYLYAIFIIFTALLHFVLKAREDVGVKYGLAIGFLLIFGTAAWVGALAVFGFNVLDQYLKIPHPEAVRIGILIYGAFLLIMTVSHLNIMKMSRGVSDRE